MNNKSKLFKKAILPCHALLIFYLNHKVCESTLALQKSGSEIGFAYAWLLYFVCFPVSIPLIYLCPHLISHYPEIVPFEGWFTQISISLFGLAQWPFYLWIFKGIKSS